MPEYVLSPKSGTWTSGPDAPRDRLLRFDMTVSYDGTPLGGNNIQVVLGAPGESRVGLDEDVVLWLESGWWVTMRNEFARAPDAARRVLESVADDLSAITADPRGAEAPVVFQSTFQGSGPSHWP